MCSVLALTQSYLHHISIQINCILDLGKIVNNGTSHSSVLSFSYRPEYSPQYSKVNDVRKLELKQIFWYDGWLLVQSINALYRMNRIVIIEWTIHIPTVYIGFIDVTTRPASIEPSVVIAYSGMFGKQTAILSPIWKFNLVCKRIASAAEWSRNREYV